MAEGRMRVGHHFRLAPPTLTLPSPEERIDPASFYAALALA